MNMNMSNELIFGRSVTIRESVIGENKEFGGFRGILFGMYQGKVNVHVLVELTEGPNNEEDWTDHVGMLLDLKIDAVQMLPSDDTGQWKLVFVKFPESKKIPAIKAIRSITNSGIREAKEMCENGMTVLLTDVSHEEATRGVKVFAEQQIEGDRYVKIERM